MNRNWRDEFGTTARTFDWDRLHELVISYVEELNGRASLDGGEVSYVLDVLRRNLRYEDLELVADAALAHDLRASVVRRQYAQALVDGGNPAAALLMYRGLADDPDAEPEDRLEARGGIGRCYKDLFLVCTDDDRRHRYLRKSREEYQRAFEEHGRPYHGINAVAMLARAGREGADPDQVRMARMADRVLAKVDNAPADDGWGQLTACEALIALGRNDEALQRAEAFVKSDPGAFNISSFLRQLTQVWQLTTTDELGHRLLPVLRSALLAHTDGQVTVEPRDVSVQRLHRLDSDTRLEAVLGRTRYQTLQWYRNGLRRCRAVARILTDNGDPVGTGFLMRGGDLHPGLPTRVLVTNGHVIPENVRAKRAVVVFHGVDADARCSPEYRVVHTWWYQPSRRSQLDTSIVELSGYPEDVEPLPLADPLGPAPTPDQRAYVIGHPKGMDQPQFSLQDNILLEFDDRLLRYRAPTDSGSSGSPVFDDEWGLIGLHHSTGRNLPRLTGGGTYPANEGIRLAAIKERLRTDPPAGPE